MNAILRAAITSLPWSLPRTLNVETLVLLSLRRLPLWTRLVSVILLSESPRGQWGPAPAEMKVSAPTIGLVDVVAGRIGEGAELYVVCVDDGNEGKVSLRNELSLIKSLSVKE